MFAIVLPGFGDDYPGGKYWENFDSVIHAHYIFVRDYIKGSRASSVKSLSEKSIMICCKVTLDP
jgi:hypothetical protein